MGRVSALASVTMIVHEITARWSQDSSTCPGDCSSPRKVPERSHSHCGAGAVKSKSLSSGSRLQQRRVGASASYPPHLCLCRVSVAPAGRLNCSAAAAEGPRLSSWRRVTPRVVSLLLPRWHTDQPRALGRACRAVVAANVWRYGLLGGPHEDSEASSLRP